MKKLLVALALFSAAAVSTSALALDGDEGPAPASAPKAAAAPTPPPAPVAKDIVATAAAAGNFTQLAKALAAAGLVETLQGAGPFTVFAPNDAAFAKVPAKDLNKLMADKAKLKKVLLFHVVSGKLSAADVGKLKEAKSMEGSELKIKAAKGKVQVDKANVTQADISASNGVIHVVDQVLMPKK
jgi:uncharacterized surface protein with fasciclin (FAS1) repeats